MDKVYKLLSEDTVTNKNILKKIFTDKVISNRFRVENQMKKRNIKKGATRGDPT